jgi:hypothetical protein
MYWLVGTNETESLRVAVDWTAPDGQVVEQVHVAAPTAQQSGRMVRVTASLAVYEYTTPGRYAADVYLADNGAQRVRLEAGRVTHSRRLPKAKIARSMEVDVGDGLFRFLGSRVRPAERVRQGARLTVDLLWQAERRPAHDYTVFVHLLGGYNPATGGPVWSQDDGYPLDGGHPTTRWLPGQIVTDRRTLALSTDIPPGTYVIEIGLYNADTGERLNVADSAQNRILIGEIQIIQ